MSKEREVEINTAKEFDWKTATKDQIRARLATILDRGIVSERLLVSLPDDLYGEWVPNSGDEIARMQAMGFEIDTEYAPKRALHGSGSGEGKVGDVIFMTAPRLVKEVIDEVRKRKFDEVHGKRKDGHAKVQKEEREAIANLSNQGLPVINESSESGVTGSEIAAQIINPGV